MRINYLILAHKHPKQLKLLVNYLLKNSCNWVLIHLDRRADSGPFFSEFQDCHDQRVKFLDKRAEVVWGGIQFVDATLFLLQESLKIQPDYHVLMSGQDLPIKPLNFICEFYQNNIGKSFMHHFPVSGTKWDYRIKNYFLPLSCCRKYKDLLGEYQMKLGVDHSRVLRRMGMVPYGGSSWWSLSRQAVSHIMKCLEQNPRLYRFFRWTWCPDEMIFQTILLNSSLRDTVINDNQLFVDWPGWPQASSHPAVLTVEHYDPLKNAKALYARKFDIEHDPKIIELVERQLLVS